MKKTIIFMATAFLLPLSMSAQDSYYYYNGTRIPLSNDPSRIVLITPDTEEVSLSESDGFKLVHDITDARSHIKVYEVTSTTVNKGIVAGSLAATANILPCYKSANGDELVPNGYLNVKLKSSADYSKLQSVAQQKGCEIIKQNAFMPLWYNLRVKDGPGRNPVEIANAIHETGEFASAAASFSIDAALISYDPEVYTQWGLYNSEYEGIDISMSKAWSYATGRGIKVAVVDTGIDMVHADLKENIDSLSYDTETGASPSQLYGEHGTHCAGIIAAVRNNGIGVVGVAPDAKIMSVSTKLELSVNPEVNIADGINWAWENGADVISCSWGCGESTIIGEAINYAVTKGREGKGCVFVAAAGNVVPHHPTTEMTYPANYGPDVIAVTNIRKDGILSDGSCFGPNTLVTAPGTGIRSTIPGNVTKEDSGTSMACPHVAAVAALILERNPSLTAVEVREIIAKNAKKVGDTPYKMVVNKIYGSWNEKYGYGLIDAYKAVITTPRQQEQ